MDFSDTGIYKLSEEVGRRMSASAKTIATAESCTGGWIAKSLTDIPGSSAWFEEGLITYGNQAKSRILRVPQKVLALHGAVSREVVEAMARGALRMSGADLAVAVTGIAGPGGAVPGKPVGTVWLCWATWRSSRMTLLTLQKRFRGDRESVRRKTVAMALSQVIRISRSF